MKWLKKLLGRDDKFFDLLEASAREAESSVGLMVKMLKNPVEIAALDEMAKTRRKDKRITEEITEQLCKTFVTPLEREDIEALSSALYRIPKTVEKFSEKYLLCRPYLEGVSFSKQTDILEQTTATVAKMVEHIRKRTHLDKIKEENDQLHYLEGEADKLILKLTHDLYTGNHDPLKVIIQMDLYDILEKVIDRCRDAGNIVFQIVLKYS
ncbi:MAG: DUF47 family protein [Verrucomicrobia bacterium]|nr:DUF47 family protein [Verrucomicrobiota bacterium]